MKTIERESSCSGTGQSRPKLLGFWNPSGMLSATKRDVQAERKVVLRV